VWPRAPIAPIAPAAAAVGGGGGRGGAPGVNEGACGAFQGGAAGGVAEGAGDGVALGRGLHGGLARSRGEGGLTGAAAAASCEGCEAEDDDEGQGDGCGSSPDEGHIEHIKPRARHPQLAFMYDNLAHSCDDPGHCGRFKRNQMLPVEPRIGCNRFFMLSVIDGTLNSASSGLTDDEKKNAADTIRILGLNSASLAWQRRRYILAVCALHEGKDGDEFIAESPFRYSLRGIL